MLTSICRRLTKYALLCGLAAKADAFAGDLGRLTKEELASGYGQVQDQPAPSPPSQSAPNGKPSQRRSPPFIRSAANSDDEDDSISSQLTGMFFGAAGGVINAAAHRVAQKVDPPGISLWESQEIASEFQFNTNWYFESRSSQQLLVGIPAANAVRFDWTGTPGFQVRLATQPLHRLGSEFLFEFAEHDERFVFSNATDFATLPLISFADNTVATERSSRLAIGQWNVLLREQTYTFAFAGLRWWHQDDELKLNVIPTGAAWRNKSKSDAPFFQFGGQYGAMGTRWMWINRVCVGFGASRNSSRTTASQIIGTAGPIVRSETDFSALLDSKSEFALAITERLSLRIGAQLIGITGRIRSAEQIDVTNLSTNESQLNNDPLLLSALFAGANYQF